MHLMFTGCLVISHRAVKCSQAVSVRETGGFRKQYASTWPAHACHYTLTAFSNVDMPSLLLIVCSIESLLSEVFQFVGPPARDR